VFHACYPALPKKKRDLYSPIFDRLRSIELDPDRVSEYFSKIVEQHNLRHLAKAALDAYQGKGSLEQVKELYERSTRPSSAGNSRGHYLWTSRFSGESLFVEPASGTISPVSLSFRNQTLQKSLGPLRRGDLGIVFARPEVGKTAFLVDCASYMVPQVPTRAVYLANEERGAGVYKRILAAATGISIRQMEKPDVKERVLTVEREIFKDKFVFLHQPKLSHKDFYAFLREAKPELIIIDQLDKIEGFDDDRHDLILGKIYIWARQLAAEFGPVIGASQAAESAEGKRWLEQNDFANSKTSKPAEGDWILGIGKTHEPALKDIRHFHIIKNKLEGDENTIEEYRHGKFDMRLESEIATYMDVMKWED
jgi:replicative DNA helicase